MHRNGHFGPRRRRRRKRGIGGVCVVVGGRIDEQDRNFVCTNVPRSDNSSNNNIHSSNNQEKDSATPGRNILFLPSLHIHLYTARTHTSLYASKCSLVGRIVVWKVLRKIEGVGAVFVSLDPSFKIPSGYPLWGVPSSCSRDYDGETAISDNHILLPLPPPDGFGQNSMRKARHQNSCAPFTTIHISCTACVHTRTSSSPLPSSTWP